MSFFFYLLNLDRHIGKMLIMGCLFKCIVPVLTIAAALCSSKSPFVSPPPHKREEASAAHRKFVKSGENSDLLATIHAYNAWVQLDNGRGDVSKFCSENYLNMTVLKEMKQLRSFFRRHLEVLGFLQGEHNAQNTDDGRFGDSDMSDIVETGDDADILRVSSAVGNFDSMNSSSSSNNSKVTSTTRFREKKVENMLLRCVIGSGLFPNFVRVCRSDGKDKKYKGKKGPGREDMRPVVVLDQYANHIFIHPSSMLNG